MIRNLTIIVLLLAPFGLLAQNYDKESIFSDTHGLKRGDNLFFEAEGYSIFSMELELKFDTKGIKKAKRMYNIDKNNIGFVDSTLQMNNKIFIQKHKISDKLTQNYIYYFFEQENNKIKAIGFSISASRDILLEKVFVESILSKTIPQDVFTGLDLKNINFAGRNIQLGSACRWMSPHNIQCPDFGQINWSEHRTKERAQKILDAQLEITLNRSMGKILERDTVNILFERNQTTALKIKYKIKIPKLIMGGSNILIIYYVYAEIRGKHLACVMSQYADDEQINDLAPLLREFMELKY